MLQLYSEGDGPVRLCMSLCVIQRICMECMNAPRNDKCVYEECSV